LGKSGLGALLGLGCEGDLGVDHAAGVCVAGALEELEVLCRAAAVSFILFAGVSDGGDDVFGGRLFIRRDAQLSLKLFGIAMLLQNVLLRQKHMAMLFQNVLLRQKHIVMLFQNVLLRQKHIAMLLQNDLLRQTYVCMLFQNSHQT
jgi:hypothetical protein